MTDIVRSSPTFVADGILLSGVKTGSDMYLKVEPSTPGDVCSGMAAALQLAAETAHH